MEKELRKAEEPEASLLESVPFLHPLLKPCYGELSYITIPSSRDGWKIDFFIPNDIRYLSLGGK